VIIFPKWHLLLLLKSPAGTCGTLFQQHHFFDLDLAAKRQLRKIDPAGQIRCVELDLNTPPIYRKTERCQYATNGLLIVLTKFLELIFEKAYSEEGCHWE